MVNNYSGWPVSSIVENKALSRALKVSNNGRPAPYNLTQTNMPNWENYYLNTSKLPVGWYPQKGLHYPTTLVLNEKEIIINSYVEHTILIQQLFKRQK